MPVILTEPAEWELWLTAPSADTRAFQRPLTDRGIGLRGEPEDTYLVS